MKMPEKHDLLAAILAAKEQGIGAILAFAMAYLRGSRLLQLTDFFIALLFVGHGVITVMINSP